MSVEAQKEMAARAALNYVEEGMVIGIGTGSTVNYFIEGLAGLHCKIAGCVSSSKASTEKLKACGIEVFDANATGDIPLYVDGADEVNQHRYLIKGGGGALTGEKIVASMAKEFICIVNEAKVVDVLGEFPLPVEVLPMARSYVARQIVKLGGDPMIREDFTTDHGNVILDIYNLKILDPQAMEQEINQIPGVITNGIFAKRRADFILVGTDTEVKRIHA
jgi:ribose 5-phosphate isomerase A